MSVKAKIKQAVDKAFTSVGDLAVDGTLASKTVSGFNFATQTTTSVSKSEVVKVIITTEEDPSGGPNSLRGLLKSGVDLSVYDTLTVDTKSYNITSSTDDGFLITASLVKEH
jgi:hypothetical protein